MSQNSDPPKSGRIDQTNKKNQATVLISNHKIFNPPKCDKNFVMCTVNVLYFTQDLFQQF